MQESSYRKSIIGKTKDYGIGQINIKTIKNFKFCQTRMVEDLNYAVEASFIVMADFKRMYKNDPEYWTRYNSSNPEKRQQYKLLVSKYL